jgi:hypothetical protein
MKILLIGFNNLIIFFVDSKTINENHKITKSRFFKSIFN